MSTKMSLLRTTACTATIALLFSASALQAAQLPPQNGFTALGSADFMAVFAQQREQQENLAWTIQGLHDMDGHKSLRLTPDEARRILPIFQKWEKDGTLLLKMPQAANSGRQQTGQQNNRGQFGAGTNLFRPGSDDPAQQSKMLADMKAKNNALAADLKKIDSYLSKEQVKFIDNMDFDGSLYGLRIGGENGPGGGNRAWSSSGNGNSGGGQPDAAAIKRMQQQMREQQERLVKLNTQVYEMLKQRAK